MADINQAKADCLYSAIDASDGFYRGRARVEDRSLMNVAFNLPTDESERRFIADSAAAGFSGLAGHRAIGGLRASIYNAMTIGAVEELAGFIKDFQRRTTITACSARSGKRAPIIHGLDVQSQSSGVAAPRWLSEAARQSADLNKTRQSSALHGHE